MFFKWETFKIETPAQVANCQLCCFSKGAVTFALHDTKPFWQRSITDTGVASRVTCAEKETQVACSFVTGAFIHYIFHAQLFAPSQQVNQSAGVLIGFLRTGHLACLSTSNTVAPWGTHKLSILTIFVRLSFLSLFLLSFWFVLLTRETFALPESLEGFCIAICSGMNQTRYQW